MALKERKPPQKMSISESRKRDRIEPLSLKNNREIGIMKYMI